MLVLARCRNPLAQLECEWYTEERKQPFRIKVASEVQFILDVHAHLSQHEVIGLLGGTWDAEDRELHIQEAFPCRALTADAGACGVVWCGVGLPAFP
jgi:protein MYSM1